MSVALPPSPYVQASEIEKNQPQEQEQEIVVAQPQVARPLPTPPSTQPTKNTLMAQVQRRGSGIAAAAAPVFGAAAAAAGVEAQKALAAKCPHCQAFLAQAKQGGTKGVFDHATRVFAPVAKNVMNNATRAFLPAAQNAAADALGKLKSRVSWLALANKIL